MHRCVLVGVVSPLGIEDELQGDVEVAIVHGAGQLLIGSAAGEEQNARWSGRYLRQVVEQFPDCGIRAIIQREENAVAATSEYLGSN